MKRNHVRGSLNAGLKDGFLWSVMTGFVDSYYLPCAIMLGAGAMGVGFVRSFPLVLGAVLLLIVDWLVRVNRSRKKVILFTVYLQVAALIVSGLCCVFASPSALYFFIPAIAVYVAAGLMVNPPWASLIAEYLPSEKRGFYLGWRERLLGFSLVFFGLVAGGILQFMKGQPRWGFAFLLFAAAAARWASGHYISKMHEPPHTRQKTESCSYVDFFLRSGNTNVASFVLAASGMMFSVFIAAPFFSIYMLRDLHFQYWQYTAILMSSQLTLYLFSQHWGNMADKYGSKKVAMVAATIIPFLPVLWMCTVKWYLLCIVELVSGAAWAAYARGSGNFMYDSVAPELRTRYLAYFGVTVGLAQFYGGLIGGFLYEKLPGMTGTSHPFMIILFISFVGRLISQWLFSRVAEPKHAPSDVSRFLVKAFDPKRMLGLEN